MLREQIVVGRYLSTLVPGLSAEGTSFHPAAGTLTSALLCTGICLHVQHHINLQITKHWGTVTFLNAYHEFLVAVITSLPRNASGTTLNEHSSAHS